ncbi:MAG: DNA polymerase III subunit delta [Anaerolineales bacterium]
MPHAVYLLYGEDEFSIAQEIAKLELKLGDPATAALNTTQLEGRSLSLPELESAVRAIPFLSSRRLVVVTDPLAKLEKDPELQAKFEALLDQVPESTALLLVEYRTSPNHKGRTEFKRMPRWLLEWAEQAGARAFVRYYPSLRGGDLQKWIMGQARQLGGRITPSAAGVLSVLVGQDTRLAYQEVQKLLAYVNYSRPVEAEDVDAVSALSGQVDIFMLVDALGMGDGRKAMSTLHRLLDEQDVPSIFGMVVRQFRLILLTKEVLEQGGSEAGVAKALDIHSFVAKKVSAQARRFSLENLEMVYRRLLEIDEAIKTGQVEAEVALDVFVSSITAVSSSMTVTSSTAPAGQVS